MAEWLTHSATVSLVEYENTGSNPVTYHRSDCCGHGCQAQKSYWKFKLELRIEYSCYLRFLFLMKLVFFQITQVWVLFFKSFNRVQSTQDEMARFIKENELKLTQVELFSFLFFLREYLPWSSRSWLLIHFSAVFMHKWNKGIYFFISHFSYSC